MSVIHHLAFLPLILHKCFIDMLSVLNWLSEHHTLTKKKIPLNSFNLVLYVKSITNSNKVG